nr:serine hydrolase domain-containing protein [Psychrobacter sp. I-STPA10]
MSQFDKQVFDNNQSSSQEGMDKLNKRQSKLQDLLQQLLQSLQLEDAPAGGAVVVYHQHKLLASAQIGQALADSAWTPDTLALNFSTGKGVLVTLVHILVSQGLLDYDTPISDYWQQFGSCGKQDITLRHVLSHQANLFDITSVTTCSRDMLDWQQMVAKIAAMPPSTVDAKQCQSAYSALVSGWVLGGLIEQVCKQPLNQVLRHYLTEPLDIADAVYFGVPADKVGQVAQPVKNFVQPCDHSQVNHASNEASTPIRTRQSKKPTLRTDSATVQAIYQKLPSYECWQQYHLQTQRNTDKPLSTLQINGLYFDVSSMSKSDYKRALVANAREPLDYYDMASLQAIIPAANGVASAKALAVIYAMLANQGRWQDNTLIDADTFAQLTKIHVTGADAVMPAAAIMGHNSSEVCKPSMQWRLGYHRIFSVCHDVADGFGHMGYNGSVAWCEPRRQLAFAFVHNFDTTMLTDIRQFALTEAVLQWFDELMV